MNPVLLLLGLLLAFVSAFYIARTITTSLLTFRALAWTPALSRRVARWVRSRDYAGDDFFRADGASEQVVTTRKLALDRLAASLAQRYAHSAAWGNQVREGFSDLRFADANRVPFPFARVMRERFNLTTVVTSSEGPRLRDLDERSSLDVSGSYGVNVAGFDRYKDWIHRGWERVKDLGPVLGPVHPLVAENIAMLRTISGLDEVSFHMSGTEAVMAAVRLARFNTGRKLIVCFSGAYHGWWDGVMAGLGSERQLGDCLILKDLHPASLALIRRRAREIAGVLVNPVQSFHPNSPPPNDAVLLTSAVRKTENVGEHYESWLGALRDLCTECDVPLIFDEVYTGFRLAPGGAQEYFEVQADLVVYGKTVAGGMPIGVVCGRRDLMRRFDAERPMRLAYVVGTFSAHPMVMGAMYEFLCWVTQPATAKLYEDMNHACAQWASSTNRKLTHAGLPLQIGHLGTIWTVLFKEPGRYNWLLQYYLRAREITLSWVGTGRCLTSMDFTERDYHTLQHALLDAASEMKNDGWWLNPAQYPERDRRMKRRLIREMVGSLIQVPRPAKAFYAEVMRRKDDDHHASHSDYANQMLHLVSSSAFIYCYFILASDLTTAMCLGLAALFVRQFGHAVLEPVCHDKEATLLGYNTRNKTIIVIGYTLIPIVHLLRANAWTLQALVERLPLIAEHWWYWTLLVIFSRVAYLIWRHSLRTSMIWYVKLVTDPVTDIITYFPRWPQRA